MRRVLRVMGLAVLAVLSVLVDVVVAVLSVLRVMLPGSAMIDHDALQQPTREFEDQHARRYRDDNRRP